MKTNFTLRLLMLLLYIISFSNLSFSQCPTTIADANFADAIRTLYPTLIGPAGNNTLTASATTYNGVLNFSTWGQTGTYSAKPKLVNVDGLQCFSNAVEFNLDNQSITNLPALPNSLKRFSCRNNQITSLPELPTSLEVLSVTQNALSALPTLPNTLLSLRCGNNRLAALPTLPNSLKFLACNAQHTSSPTFVATPSEAIKLLTSLPTLPTGLQHLDANNNKLTSLPLLPESLIWLRLNNNSGLTCLPSLPDNFFTTALNASTLYDKSQAEPRLNVTTTGINCLSNLPSNWASTKVSPSTMGAPGSACSDLPIISSVTTTCAIPGFATGTATVVATANGVATFEYSKDGTLFQTSNLLSNLLVGNSTIYTRRVSGTACPSAVATTNITVGQCAPANCTPITDDNFADALRTLYPTLIGAVGDNTIYETATSYSGKLDFSSWGLAGGLYANKPKLTNIEGIQCFSMVSEINLNNQSLITIPSLSPNLKRLFCRNNKLTSLPTLPAGLEQIDATQNALSFLPDLPNTLLSLKCANNRLTSLPTLPNSLKFLACNSQHSASPTFVATPSEATKLLTSLPTLPEGLQHLEVGHNKLTSLPTLPSSLVWLKVNNNVGLTCLPLLPDNFFTTALNSSILYDKSQSEPRFNVSASGVTCLPNLPSNWSAAKSNPSTMGAVGSLCTDAPTINSVQTTCSVAGASTGVATINASINGGLSNFEYSNDGTNFQANNYYVGLPTGNHIFYVRRITGSACPGPTISSQASVNECTPTIYYVNPNTGIDNDTNGTLANPWKTIQYAVSKVPAGGGHTIQLSAGTFNETGIITIPSATNLIGAGANLTTININSYYSLQSSFMIPNTCAVDTSFNPAPDKFVMQVNGYYQRLSGFSMDGQNKKCHGAIYLTNSIGLTLDDLKVSNFNFSGIWFNKCSNVELKNSTIRNNAFGNKQSSMGNVMFWEMNNFLIHDNLIEELTPTRYGSDVGSYGIKAFAPYWYIWCIDNNYREQNIRAISKSVKIYNNNIKVLTRGTWTTNNNTVPSISIEFFQLSFQDCEIYNNYIDNHMSIVGNNKSGIDGFQIISNAMRIHDNYFDLGTRYSYAVEADASGLEIDHNYINGGHYPLAQWNSGKVGFTDHKIHHNIFYAPKGGQNLLHYYTFPSNFVFTNNTVIDSDGAGISGLFRNTPKANLPTGAVIKNNIFQSNIGNRGDLFIDTNFDNPSISKNVFFNIDAFGDNAIVADPKLKLIGDKPKPYFELGAGSPAIDAGEIIPGITDGYNGSLPDIGVYETESISAVLSGSDTLCLGQSANLYVDIVNGVAPFTVVLNDGTSDTTITNYQSGFPIVITPTSTKTYTIASVTDSSGFVANNVQGTVALFVKAPKTPTDFLATIKTAKGRIELNWQLPNELQSSYIIERQTESNSFLQLANLIPTVNTFTDSTVSLSTNYSYRIYSKIDECNSAYSATTTAILSVVPIENVISPVRPVLECVSQLPDNTYRAYFGYLNENNVIVSIPVGNKNKFTPGTNLGQPTNFLTGRQYKAFYIPFSSGNIVWTLNGRTSTASTGSARCSGSSSRISVETENLISSENSEVVVYPNPNKGKEFSVRGVDIKADIQLLSITGLHIPTKRRESNQEIILEVNQHLANGIYLLVIKHGAIQISKKIIVNNSLD